MPPKKNKDEVDISTLPPWFSVHTRLLFRTRKEREENLIDQFTEKPLSFKKLVNREILTAAAKEKGFYVDPETLTDKQKKDPKFLEETDFEMNPKVLAKTCFTLLQEWELNGRKEKKEMIDEKERELLEAQLNAQPSPPKKDEDTKIDVPIISTEPVVEKEKDYSKACDSIIAFLDYPTTKEEIQALANIKVPIHCFYRLTEMPPELEIEEEIQKVEEKDFLKSSNHEINSISKTDRSFASHINIAPTNKNIEILDEGKDNEVNDEIENEDQVIEEEKPYYQDIDYTHMKNINECVGNLNFLKNGIESKPIIRDCYLNDVEGEEIEEPLQVFEKIVEDICSLSFDILAYEEWKKGKSKENMIKLFRPEIPEELLNAMIGVQESQAKVKPKGKKDVEQLEKEEAERKKRQEDELKEMLEEMKPKLTDLTNFRAKIEKIPESKVTGGVLLRYLLEELISKTEIVDDEEEEGELVFDECIPKSKKEKIQKIKIIEVNEENNRISKKSPEDMPILSEFSLPGIARHLMPEVPDKSKDIRHVERCQVYPFSDGKILHYERIDQLIRLQKISQKFRRGEKVDFSDRKIEDLHNQKSIIDTFLRILEYTPHIESEYVENKDSLLVAFLHHNPDDAVARYQTSFPWRVIPNLESWIKNFKNSEEQSSNLFYYNLDLWEAGHIQEHIKYLYPPNNTFLMSRQIKLGLNESRQGILVCDDLKLILKDNLLKGDEYSTRFYVENENNSFNLTIKLEDSNIIKIQNENEFIFENNDETRIIIGKGTVIKYSKNSATREILYANGNYSSRDVLGNWTSTNNKGFRKMKYPNGDERQLEEIPCAHRTCPKAQTRVMIREDNVISLSYLNKEVFTQHKDGTRMMTKSNSTIVEHPNFSTLTIYKNRELEEFNEIDTRSPNNWAAVCDLLDGSQIMIYYDEDGDIVKRYKLSSGTILTINKNGICKLKGEEFEYKIDLVEGLFSCEDEKKFYKLQKNGECKLEEKSQDEIKPKEYEIPLEFERPGTPIFDEDMNGLEPLEEDIEVQEVKEELQDKSEEHNEDDVSAFVQNAYTGIRPRIFEVNFEGSKEFINEDMMKCFKTVFSKQINSELCQIENEDYKTMLFLKRDETLKNKRKIYIQPIIPSLDILRGDTHKFVSKQPLNLKNNYYLLRCMKIYGGPTQEDLEWFKERFTKFEEWKRNSRFKSLTEFGVGIKEFEVLHRDAYINTQILKARMGNYSTESLEDSKLKAIEFLWERLQSYLTDLNLKAKELYIESERIDKKRSVKRDISQKFYTDVNIENIVDKDQDKRVFPYIDLGFVPNYFQTFQGEEFIKNNPISDPPQKKRNLSSDQTLKELEGNNQNMDEENEYNDQFNEENEENKHNDLDDEDNDGIIQEKSIPKIMKKGLSMSVFKKEEILEARKEAELKEKEAKQKALKGKNYNVYGFNRTLPQPKVLNRPIAKAELNQKYILTDSATERRVRTISMANREFFKATNLEELRHTGPHQIMLNARDKKFSMENLLERRTIMITSDIDDKLKRDLLIKPEFVDFGTVRKGSFYETVISLQNEDVIPLRISLRNPRSKFIKIIQIAMGMSCKVFIRIDTTNMKNYVQDEFEIVTRLHIYKIPISIIVSTAEETFKKKLIPGVRELKIKREEFADSSSSDFLPKILGLDRQFKLGTVDQYMKYEDQHNKNEEQEEFNY